MKKYFVLTICILGILLSGSASQAASQEALNVLDQITLKASEVKGYQCRMQKILSETKDEVITKGKILEEQGFHQPNKFYRKRKTVESGVLSEKGQFEHVIFDGIMLMKMVRNEPGTGKHLKEELEKEQAEYADDEEAADQQNIAEEIAKAVEDHEKTIITQYNYLQYTTQGYPEEDILNATVGWSIRPNKFFKDYEKILDMDTLQIESQTDKEWVLNVHSIPVIGTEFTVTVARNSGLVQRVINKRNDSISTTTITGFKLTPNINPNLFDTSVPDGVDIVDGSEQALMMLGFFDMLKPTYLHDDLKTVSWQVGPCEGKIGDKAIIKLPKGYVFTGPEGAREMMRLTGNLLSDLEVGLFAPESLDWIVVFEYEGTGHVKDDEKNDLNADKMMKQMKKNDKVSNKERKKRGLGSLNVIGWKSKPHYDEGTNNLSWAMILEDENGNINTNYNTKYLGREGVMNTTLIADANDDQIYNSQLADFKNKMEQYSFVAGSRYAEFKQGDKIAEYGLTALILGGATAVAVKTGLFRYLGKFIVLIVAAVGAFFKKIFGGKTE